MNITDIGPSDVTLLVHTHRFLFTCQRGRGTAQGGESLSNAWHLIRPPEDLLRSYVAYAAYFKDVPVWGMRFVEDLGNEKL